MGSGNGNCHGVVRELECEWELLHHSLIDPQISPIPPLIFTGVKKCEIWSRFQHYSTFSSPRLKMQQSISETDLQRSDDPVCSLASLGEKGGLPRVTPSRGDTRVKSVKVELGAKKGRQFFGLVLTNLVLSPSLFS